MNKKHQTKGLPEKVIFCKKCVISNQRPSSSIEFKNHQGEKRKLFTLMKMEFALHADIMRRRKKILIGRKERTP